MVVIKKHKPSRMARARNLNIRRREAARLSMLTTVPSVVELRNPTYAEAMTSSVPVEENEEENGLLEVIRQVEEEKGDLRRERRMLLEERREDKKKILALETEIIRYRERIMRMDVTLAEEREETRKARRKYQREHTASLRAKEGAKRAKEEMKDVLTELEVANSRIDHQEEEMEKLNRKNEELERSISSWMRIRQT